jgi:hypothetical protein
MVCDAQAFISGDLVIGDADAGHFRRFGGEDTDGGVLKDETTAALDAEEFGGAHVDRGMGLAIHFIFGGTDNIKASFRTQGFNIGIDHAAG